MLGASIGLTLLIGAKLIGLSTLLASDDLGAQVFGFSFIIGVGIFAGIGMRVLLKHFGK